MNIRNYFLLWDRSDNGYFLQDSAAVPFRYQNFIPILSRYQIVILILTYFFPILFMSIAYAKEGQILCINAFLFLGWLKSSREFVNSLNFERTFYRQRLLAEYRPNNFQMTYKWTTEPAFGWWAQKHWMRFSAKSSPQIGLELWGSRAIGEATAVQQEAIKSKRRVSNCCTHLWPQEWQCCLVKKPAPRCRQNPGILAYYAKCLLSGTQLSDLLYE